MFLRARARALQEKKRTTTTTTTATVFRRADDDSPTRRRRRLLSFLERKFVKLTLKNAVFFLELFSTTTKNKAKKKRAKRKKPGNTPTSHVITNRNTIGAQRGLNALC